MESAQVTKHVSQASGDKPRNDSVLLVKDMEFLGMAFGL